MGITSGISEIVYVPIGATFRSDIASYKVASVLSSFTVIYAGGGSITLNINVQCGTIIPGSTNQSFAVWTKINKVTKMSFTYFMVDLMSYPFTPFAYTTRYFSWALPAYVTVPLLYQPRVSYNCMIGASAIDSGSFSGGHHLTMTPSVNVDLTRMY